jgi:hypothetical protein
MHHEAGGEILLTTMKCARYRNGRTSGAGGGASLHGCAHVLPPARIYVSWTTGTPVSYGWMAGPTRQLLTRDLRGRVDERHIPFRRRPLSPVGTAFGRCPAGSKGIDAPGAPGGPACERSLTQRARHYLATLASGTAQVDLGEPDKFGGRIDARVTARGADLLSAMLGHAPPPTA